MLAKYVFDEFLIDCEIRGLTKRTIKSYRNSVDYFLNYLADAHGITDIDAIRTVHIKDFFLFQQKKGCKETYINGLHKTLRAYFKYAMQEEYIIRNPILNISWAKEPKLVIKAFSDAEVKRMLSIYKGIDYLTVRNRTILCILFDTGIRCQELCELTTSAVREKNICIYGKGNKERFVGVSPFLRRELMRYEKIRSSYFAYKRVPPYYFLSRTGKQLTNVAVERVVRLAGEQANISADIRCSPHTCRHYFAHAQIKLGTDVYSLSRLLGHENIKITQRYLQGMEDGDIVDRSCLNSPLMNL